MDKEVFDQMMWDLSIYFERKPPGQDTMRQWYEEVRDIPASAQTYLMGQVRELESWPRNLPHFLKARYFELREKNGGDQPFKIHDRRFHPERYAKSNCPKCQGKGVYDFPMDWPVAKEKGKLITRHVVRPALCECTEGAEYGF